MRRKKPRKKEYTHIRVSTETKKRIDRIKMIRGESSTDATIQHMAKYSQTKGVEHEMNQKSMELEELLRIYYPDGLAEIMTNIRQINSLTKGLPTDAIQQAIEDLTDITERVLADLLNTQITGRFQEKTEQETEPPGGAMSDRKRPEL